MALERYHPGSKDWSDISADHLARYNFAVGYAKGNRVVDAGTGHGYGAALMAASGAASVYAIDIDVDVVEAARALYSLKNLTFAVGDSEKLEQVPIADLVVSFENIEHLRNPRRFLDAASSILAPNGVLLCSTPDRSAMPPFVDGKPANPFHVNEWYPNEFAMIVGEYFSDVQMHMQVRSGPAERRRAGAEEVQRFLRENILFKGYRYIARLLGKEAFTPAANLIGIPDFTDFPIVPDTIASLFGSAWCSVAVCRQPRRCQSDES